MLGCKSSDCFAAAALVEGINRYMLGCKFFKALNSISTEFRINRYMLGCKFNSTGKNTHTYVGINRYMLGCKFCYPAARCCYILELIDTCWDVNLNVIMNGTIGSMN